MLLDAFADLVLGSACVACDRPGRPLCRPCRDALPVTAAPAWPTPVPGGLVTPYATGAYDGALRAMVLAHKERRVLALTRPLGQLLAVSVTAALEDAGVRRGSGPVTLVPVPSRRSAVRARGHDPTLAMARDAARRLPEAGPATVARLLRLRPGVADQAGLSSGQRHANLAGSMACSSAAVERLRHRHERTHVVVCDDVLTTGATAREAQRALEAAGVRVLAVTTVAATRKWSDGGFPGLVGPSTVDAWSPPGSVVAPQRRPGEPGAHGG